MFPLLSSQRQEVISDAYHIRKMLESPAFREFEQVNILPLIYDENNKKCNILVFDYERAKRSIETIRKVESGRGRIHPVFQFLDAN